jgi:hsp70-interacting protein
MADPRTNNVLRWAVENSDASKSGPTPAEARTPLDQEALRAMLFGGDILSEPEQMKKAMEEILHADSTLEIQRNAFTNLEFLLENIDNANNLEPLKLWMPLVELLGHEEAEIRMHAAWCCKLAVENNIKAQERVSRLLPAKVFEPVADTVQILVTGAIPTLVRLATEDADAQVRKKAIGAISSTIRNFQPGLDAVHTHMPAAQKPQPKVDASDMDSIDTWMDKLRAPA